MFSDNETFFHDEKRHIETRTEQLGEGLGYLVSGRDPEGRYTYTKDIISDPHVPCLLQRTRVEAAPEILRKLKIYACLAPHIEVAGWGDNGHVVQAIDRELLDAVLGGYGQRDDGGPSEGFGRGRAWPLLTGERGHYEIAAGRDASDQIRWMEGLATPTKILPEQVWDQEDLPHVHMHKGKPTGSATPLLWAHAEYIKLLRSREEGKAFDLIACVANRYLGERPPFANLHFWSPLAPRAA